jgi:hypothetical protein
MGGSQTSERQSPLAHDNPASARPALPKFLPLSSSSGAAAAETSPPSRGIVSPPVRVAASQSSSNDVHQLNAVSNAPFNVEINTVDPAKLIAFEILRRHHQIGSFQQSETGDKTPSRHGSKIAVFFSMVLFHGVRREHFNGLHVPFTSDEIAETVGLKRSIAYVSTRALVESKMIVPVWVGRTCYFDILMPEMCGRSQVEATQTKDLQSRRRDATFDSARATFDTVDDPQSRRRDATFDSARATFDSARASQNDTTSCIELNCNAMQLGSADQGEPEEESAKVALLISGGFDPDQPGLAIALARHPECTLERIHEAIRRCDETQKAGRLRGTRAAFITNFIKKRWLPRSDGADKKRELETRQRRQSERAVEVEAENQKTIADIRAERHAPPPPQPAGPKSEQQILREKIEILSALPADEIRSRVDQIIAEESQEFVKKAYQLNRETPFKMPTLVAKLFAMHTGSTAQLSTVPLSPPTAAGAL